jgi:hypothetical protein
MFSQTSGRGRAVADPKISASTIGKILGAAVLTIMGGWAGLNYYKLQADVRVLQLDQRMTVIERKIDQVIRMQEEEREERKRKPVAGSK